ncbi:MAG: ATP-binding protein [Thermoanaerobaculia bacterium]|nr:ATP-binding protein [Thermoanaerobaculia bacterium]
MFYFLKYPLPLNLSKLESGALKLNRTQADVVQYLQYLTESFYSMAEEKKIRLTFYSETPELVMDYDEEKIQYVVYNLLPNAIKFTPSGSGDKVIFHTRQVVANGQPALQLKVRDTGAGIPPEKLPHIFDRFYQADNSTTRKGDGTGIGLTLTKELVELMDGSITVQSEPGKGTEFTVVLPVTREAPLVQ